MNLLILPVRQYSILQRFCNGKQQEVTKLFPFLKMTDKEENMKLYQYVLPYLFGYKTGVSPL